MADGQWVWDATAIGMGRAGTAQYGTGSAGQKSRQLGRRWWWQQTTAVVRAIGFRQITIGAFVIR